MKCPGCNKQYSNPIRRAIICDNNCGTVYCLCETEFYQTNEQQTIKGHNPSCGQDAQLSQDSSEITITRP